MLADRTMADQWEGRAAVLTLLVYPELLRLCSQHQRCRELKMSCHISYLQSLIEYGLKLFAEVGFVLKLQFSTL